MALPLKETVFISRKASKPGNIYDYFVRQQDINNAVYECVKDISNDFPNPAVNKVITDKIKYWLLVEVQDGKRKKL